MREHLRSLALKLVGCPYIWGGSNPWTGFDCSGFVEWVYQVFGILPAGRTNAQGLFEHFRMTSDKLVAEDLAGGLEFYGKSVTEITHVMIGLGGGLVVGASGGDHTTTTVEEARRRGAMVKVKPLKYRNDLLVSLHVPFPGEK